MLTEANLNEDVNYQQLQKCTYIFQKGYGQTRCY